MIALEDYSAQVGVDISQFNRDVGKYWEDRVFTVVNAPTEVLVRLLGGGYAVTSPSRTGLDSLAQRCW